MIRTFLKDSAVYVIPSAISRGLSLLLVPLYTRVLSPADYGAVDMLTIFAGIVNLTIALEVTQGVARFYATEDDPDRKVLYASSAFWFTLAVYSVFAALALLLTARLSPWVLGRAGMDDIFRIGIAYVWASGLLNLVQNQFRWELRSRQYAAVSLLLTLSTAGISVLLACGLRWGLEGFVVGMAGGSLLAIGLGLWWLRGSFRFRMDWVRLREMLAFSSPLVFSGIAIWLGMYVDRLLLNHYLSVGEVGIYGIGYRVAGIAGLVMVGFQGALTPLVYKHQADPQMPRDIARIFRVCLALCLLAFAGLSLFSGQIVRLMATEPFYGGAVVVVYLTPVILIGQLYIFAPGISLAKKNHYEIYINIAGALMNAGLGFCLIPHLGVVGAGLGALLSCISVFSMRMFLSQRLFPIPYEWHRIIFAAVAVGVLVAVVSGLRLEGTLSWAINVLAGVGTLILIVLSGMIRPSEIRQAAAAVQTKLHIHSGQF